MKDTGRKKKFKPAGAGAFGGMAAKITGIFYSPISSMSGIALFIIASCRFSYAIAAAGALFWVFMLSAFINTARHGIVSKVRNKMLNVMLSSFVGGIYFFLLYMLNPLFAMETSLVCALAPVYFIGSKFSAAFENLPADEIFSEARREPLSLGVLIMVFSLVREPLGFATISIPGGSRGITELFGSPGGDFYPIQFLSSSTGALILLAYVLVIFYRPGKIKKTDGESL
ncbi:MAG: hypothetical protein LBF80_01395 [Spirochaetaceae bacterium]|jgi:hypothetical protein|nr:hypothetical protein [Spirochaetaceae bacterium]